MSDVLEIPSDEHGLVRVFTVDLPLDEAQILLDDEARALQQKTGAIALDPDHIDLFDMNDLSGLPLADYLAEGHGIPDEELAPIRAQLERVKGRVMVMRSAAFERIGQQLRVTHPLRWIATFGEARDPVPLEKPRAESARPPEPEAPPAAPPPPAAAARMMRPGLIIGLVVTMAVLGVVLWALA
ncbi:MAG: hypothetical protein RID15_15985 [Marinovum algicola]|mgnify:FL=1|jgi:hypothetical protein|uniref:Uncharacterized protein n=1 Tax=Marinovum algicola TaxID=42444 RepID=A0A975W5Y2_9RHOB|nr:MULTISPECIES: hypothetical protein [Marinovum]MDD9742132.1 hypothetical protein [Marinovum sp. SP66]MDD9743515.1 hypothetical protein [Marinovum sp. PR37]SEI51750.1 hypothetical protein SAMN04487940_10179 [Marinovum algicola]SLN30135.1 hypothetical protein MAA5396_01378 [Marinovum algicola]